MTEWWREVELEAELEDRCERRLQWTGSMCWLRRANRVVCSSLELVL